MQLKKTRWSTYNINYHFVWIPKYRRKILTNEIKQELEKILKDISEKHEIEILSFSIQPDHIYLFVSAPPRLAPADIVNLFNQSKHKSLCHRHCTISFCNDFAN